jgi:hypothetical protein
MRQMGLIQIDVAPAELFTNEFVSAK